ncbi:PKD domain-containing protein [Cellulomonas sp. JZ18]|uniref:PKD domain-containing protein n=1 Tax=Cellulomonas sp. JZ18 TaxID=2654191 RepID=UPI0012D37DA4|nr:PKD domain-containing protein [Cellulomonas sp. JZ18]QGQ20154.1 PKD domain-containing protein [Cellulomonas sp. JZ18]
MHSFFRSTRGPVRAVAAAAVTAGVVVVLSPTAATAVPRQEWPVLAADAFSRTTPGAWGSADAGGAWTHNGPASSYTVAGGVGSLVVPRAGSTIQSTLATVASTDTDVSLTVAADKAMTGSGAHIGVTARRVGSQEYGAKLRLLADGTATIALVDAGTVLPGVALPGTVAPGERIAVRVQASGTSPTTLRAKAWRAGQAEPADWTVSATSTTAALQAPGAVGVGAYLAGNVTNAPVAFGFDDLRVTTANPVVVPNTAPVAAIDAATARKSLVARVDGSRSSDADGAVSAWAWDFGDGATASGRSAEHAYATPGTYTVTLTVTDDEGATATTTRPVTVTAPNVAPTAAFAAPVVDGLTASVDAGASADADGTVAAYAWDFGDGTTATGATARHTWKTGGSYPVRLTVTDDDGATATASRTVTVAAPAPAPTATTGASATTIVRDTFATARTSGWGTAQTGGTWTHAGTASDYKVASGAATQTITKAGSSRTSSLTSVSSKAIDLAVTTSVDKAQTGTGTYVSVIGRQVGTAAYSARLRYLEDGTVQLAAMRGSTALSTADLGAVSPGTQLRVRLQVTGTSPTTVQARAWRTGTTEPTTWQVTAKDSDAALQKAGSVALSSYLSGSVTNAPMTVSYRDLVATTPGSTTPAPAPAPAPAPDKTVATGRPNADNTGVPAGTTFSKVHEGNLVITQPGTVIDGWDIRGYVTVKASNVVIRNSYIRGTATPQAADLVRVQGDAYSLTIEDSTLIPQTMSANQDGVKGWNFTLRRVEIAKVIDPVHIHGSNVLVERSWLHDNAHYEKDPNWNGTPSHDDSIQLQKGSNITIRDNTIEGSHNAALMLTQDAGAVSKVAVTGNFIDGGACTINIKNASIGAPTGVTIAGNTFGRNTQYKNCSVRVPTSYALDMRDNVYPDGVAVKRTNI